MSNFNYKDLSTEMASEFVDMLKSSQDALSVLVTEKNYLKFVNRAQVVYFDKVFAGRKNTIYSWKTKSSTNLTAINANVNKFDNLDRYSFFALIDNTNKFTNCKQTLSDKNVFDGNIFRSNHYDTYSNMLSTVEKNFKMKIVFTNDKKVLVSKHTGNKNSYKKYKKLVNNKEKYFDVLGVNVKSFDEINTISANGLKQKMVLNKIKSCIPTYKGKLFLSNYYESPNQRSFNLSQAEKTFAIVNQITNICVNRNNFILEIPLSDKYLSIASTLTELAILRFYDFKDLLINEKLEFSLSLQLANKLNSLKPTAKEVDSIIGLYKTCINELANKFELSPSSILSIAKERGYVHAISDDIYFPSFFENDFIKAYKNFKNNYKDYSNDAEVAASVLNNVGGDFGEAVKNGAGDCNVVVKNKKSKSIENFVVAFKSGKNSTKNGLTAIKKYCVETGKKFSDLKKIFKTKKVCTSKCLRNALIRIIINADTKFWGVNERQAKKQGISKNKKIIASRNCLFASEFTSKFRAIQKMYDKNNYKNHISYKDKEIIDYLNAFNHNSTIIVNAASDFAEKINGFVNAFVDRIFNEKDLIEIEQGSVMAFINNEFKIVCNKTALQYFKKEFEEVAKDMNKDIVLNEELYK